MARAAPHRRRRRICFVSEVAKFDLGTWMRSIAHTQAMRFTIAVSQYPSGSIAKYPITPTTILIGVNWSTRTCGSVYWGELGVKWSIYHMSAIWNNSWSFTEFYRGVPQAWVWMPHAQASAKLTVNFGFHGYYAMLVTSPSECLRFHNVNGHFESTERSDSYYPSASRTNNTEEPHCVRRSHWVISVTVVLMLLPVSRENDT